MGRGHGDQHLPSAFLSFPSPASVTSSLSSPILEKALHGSLACSARQTPHLDLIGTTDIVPAEPGTASALPLVSPPALEMVDPGLDTLVGGTLIPTASSNPSARPPLKAGPDLRLPSFDALGIAAPHPDRYGAPSSFDGTLNRAAREAMREPYSAPHTHSSMLAAFDDLDIRDGKPTDVSGSADQQSTAKSPGRAMRQPVPRYVETLTPPAECPEPDWSLTKIVLTAPMESSTTNDQPSTTHDQTSASADASRSGLPSHTVPNPVETSGGPRMWIDGAIDALRKPVQRPLCSTSH